MKDTPTPKPIHILKVGEPYLPGTHQMAPGVEYAYRAGAHQLVLFVERPTEKEVRAVQTAPVDLAVHQSRWVTHLLFRLEPAFGWCDAPFAPHMERFSTFVLPPFLKEGERPLLTIILVDASTGLVRAIRVGTLPRKLAMTLHSAIRLQHTAPFSQQLYDEDLVRLNALYPTSALMLQNARCRGRLGE